MEPQLQLKEEIQIRNAGEPGKVLEECEVGSNMDRQKNFIAEWNNGYNQVWFLREVRNGNMHEIGSKAKEDHNLEIYYSNKGSQTRVGKKGKNKDSQSWIL